MLTLIFLLLVNTVRSKNIYQFSFTAVDSANHGYDLSYCTYDYQSATYTLKMDVCENYDSWCCGETNCPDPCTHSSIISKLSDDNTYWYSKYYDEHGCKEENFLYDSNKKYFDVCLLYEGSDPQNPPPCDPKANFDACALRYNGTNADDDTCNGMKHGYCYDRTMYSLSQVVPK